MRGWVVIIGMHHIWCGKYLTWALELTTSGHGGIAFLDNFEQVEK